MLLCTCSINFDNMRSRELRKHLLKLGHDREELSKILDRKELKVLAEEFYNQKRQYDDDAAFRARGVQFSIGCIVVASIFIFWGPISTLFSSFRSSVDGFVYQIKERFRLISMSIVNRFPLAAVCLMLAVFLDVLQPLIQLSILASWIIPTASPFRRFLIPMPNFPITIDHFLGKKEGRSSKPSSSIGDIGGMGVNVAPMILMYVSSYLKHRLEDFGASRLISVVEAKQKRRDGREAVRTFRSKLDLQSKDVMMDFADASDTNIDRQQYSSSCGSSINRGDRENLPERVPRPVGHSPFEQHQGSMRSTFLEHVHNGPPAAFQTDECTVDDGDFWLTEETTS